MFFEEKEFKVWRYTAPVDNWGDPTYVYLTTVKGTVQPFSGDDGIRNHQNVKNVRLVLDLPIDTIVEEEDELEDAKGKFHRIYYIQPWDSGILPHNEVFMGDTQWVRK